MIIAMINTNMTIQTLRNLAEKAKTIPKAEIEYSCELPECRGVSSEEIFGVKATFNKNVPVATGATIINRY